MTRRLLILLLLPLLLGADEIVNPDDTAGVGEANYDDSTLTACTTGDCPGDVDEGASSPDGNVVTTTNTGAQTITWNFPDAASAPSTTTDAQVIKFVASKCNASQAENASGGNPTVSITVLCGVTTKDTCATDVAVTGLDQLFTCNWTFDSSNCGSLGGNMSISFAGTHDGGGPNRRFACIEAIDWEVTYAAAGGRTRRSF